MFIFIIIIEVSIFNSRNQSSDVGNDSDIQASRKAHKRNSYFFRWGGCPSKADPEMSTPHLSLFCRNFSTKKGATCQAKCRKRMRSWGCHMNLLKWCRYRLQNTPLFLMGSYFPIDLPIVTQHFGEFSPPGKVGFVINHPKWPSGKALHLLAWSMLSWMVFWMKYHFLVWYPGWFLADASNHHFLDGNIIQNVLIEIQEKTSPSCSLLPYRVCRNQLKQP